MAARPADAPVLLAPVLLARGLSAALRGALLVGALLVGTLLVGGCATRPAAETATYDGLVPVKAAGLQNAWVRPDIDLARYQKLMLAPVEFEFRAVDTADSRRTSGSEFPVSPENRKRLAETVTTVFREELARSRQFTLAEEPAPDTLTLRTSLLDIVSRVPPEQSGREDIYLDRVGEATLVVELQDSMGGQTLARAVDRRAAETFGGGLSGGVSVANRIDSVTAWSEVRQLAERWARVVTQRLDQLRTRSAMPGAEPTAPLR